MSQEQAELVRIVRLAGDLTVAEAAAKHGLRSTEVRNLASDLSIRNWRGHLIDNSVPESLPIFLSGGGLLFPSELPLN